MKYQVVVNTHARGGVSLLKGQWITPELVQRIGADGIEDLLKVGFIKPGTDQATPVIAEQPKPELIDPDQIVEDELEEKPKSKKKGK